MISFSPPPPPHDKNIFYSANSDDRISHWYVVHLYHSKTWYLMVGMVVVINMHWLWRMSFFSLSYLWIQEFPKENSFCYWTYILSLILSALEELSIWKEIIWNHLKTILCPCWSFSWGLLKTIWNIGIIDFAIYLTIFFLFFLSFYCFFFSPVFIGGGGPVFIGFFFFQFLLFFLFDFFQFLLFDFFKFTTLSSLHF